MQSLHLRYGLSLYLVFILTLTGWSELKADESKPPQLLKMGTYHGDEVQAQDGEQWLGLFQLTGSKQFELRPTTLRIEAVTDPVLDEAGQQTGKKVTLKNESVEPLILVKNIETIRIGKVPTLRASFIPFLALHGGDTAIKNQKLKLNSSTTLLIDSLPILEPKTKKAFKRLMLTLVESETAQMLSIPTIHSDSEGQPGLLWVGDLDDDGYLDFLMNLSTHANVTHLSLFLSSYATRGNLIKKVVEWVTTGC